MAMTGGGISGEGSGAPGQGRASTDPGVSELLQKLNLTAEEEEVLAFSDDKATEEIAVVEWALVGKVLSPSVVHANTVREAMRPAWGNPYGMAIRSIGQRGENLFVAEFGTRLDMNRALTGSPWIVGKHAVVLKEYDETMRPSDIKFDQIEMWVRIMDLPLGWMNQHRGERAMGLIGTVVKMDVDGGGKASGPFLRARVAIDATKPLRRGIFLRTKKDEEPVWYNILYEKLLFYCYSCGIMGHTDLECANLVPRNEEGKLPYEKMLRAPDDRRRKLQNFAQADVEAYGSSSSGQSRSSTNRPGDQRSFTPRANAAKEREEEISSPLKRKEPTGNTMPGTSVGSGGRQLFSAAGPVDRQTVRKRKSKTTRTGTSPTPDLNLPSMEISEIVPIGLVHVRVAQLASGQEEARDVVDELLKKQWRATPDNNARSAAAAGDSPRRAQ
ncbi:unnamed protein product [Urochloa humidicola]